MKKIFLLLLPLFVACNFQNEGKKTNTEDVNSKKPPQSTVYYLIRHAEKETGKDPELTDEGKQRAKKWAKIFREVPFKEVYSTNYKRSMATARPTAKEKGLSIRSYNPDSLYSEDFKKETHGKTVLVVGHSNTTPAFVNAITGSKYKNLPDNEYGALFIVTVYPDGKTDTQELFFN
ncbi:MAG: histidine phosphatase family protein [Gillisia sp.]